MTRLIGSALGFGGFWTARRTLQAMAMISKGHVRNIGQAEFIAGLFQLAA